MVAAMDGMVTALATDKERLPKALAADKERSATAIRQRQGRVKVLALAPLSEQVRTMVWLAMVRRQAAAVTMEMAPAAQATRLPACSEKAPDRQAQEQAALWPALAMAGATGEAEAANAAEVGRAKNRPEASPAVPIKAYRV